MTKPCKIWAHCGTLTEQSAIHGSCNLCLSCMNWSGGMLLPICSKGNQLGLEKHSYPCADYVNIYPVCRRLLDAKSEAWLGKWDDKHWWRGKITPWIKFTVDNWFQFSSMFYVYCVLLLNAYYLTKAWPIAKKKHSKLPSWKQKDRIILR